MAAMQTYKCKCCNREFRARVADRNRGWARYCSKSCKAVRQTQKTGVSGPSRARTYHCQDCGADARKYLGAGEINYLCDHHAAEWSHPMSSDALGQWQ